MHSTGLLPACACQSICIEIRMDILVNYVPHRWVADIYTGLNSLCELFVLLPVEQAKLFREIVAKDEQEILASNSSTKSLIVVYNYFKKYLVSEIKLATETLRLSFNLVAFSVKTLAEMGILKMENEQSRHQLFIYRELLGTMD